jgi:photosystem II stability/assembly factor-like uncharacterized protein
MSHRFIVRLFLFVVVAVAADAQWEESHGIRGHHLSSVLSRNATVWIGTRSGGVFWSSGGDFVPSRQGLPVGEVEAIMSDSLGVIYAGVEGGTYRSTDAGRSWQRIAEVDGAMRDLATAGSRVFLATGVALYSAEIASGVFTRVVDPVLGDAQITAVESSGSLLLAGTTIAVFRSSDLGATWTYVPIADPSEFPFPTPVESIAISPAGVTAFLSRLYYSSDSGRSYMSLPELPDFRIYSLVSDGDRVIAATGSGVSASTDGGKTFATLLSTPNRPVLDLSRNGDRLVAVTDQDIYTSTDRGASWTMRTPSIEALAVTDVASMGSEVFAIADSALYRSTNNGRDFTRASSDTTRLGLRDVQIGSDGIFALAGPYTILRSRDAGAHWTDVSGIVADSGFPVALIHVDGSTIIAATHFYGIYYSSDNGDTWNVTKDDSPDRILDHPESFATWLGEIYLATRYNFLRSTDKGATWISEGRFGGLDRSIVVLGNDEYNFYAATSNAVYMRAAATSRWISAGNLAGVRSLVMGPGTVYAGTGRNGVWMTPHGGPLWQRVDDMTGPAADINELAISGDRIVAATGMNVWTSNVELGAAVRENPDLPQSLNARYDVADGALHLSLSLGRPADLDIDLVDMRGVVVRELLDERMEGAVEKRFPIDSFPAGLYFISVRTGHGATSVPVMITGDP